MKHSTKVNVIVMNSYTYCSNPRVDYYHSE